MHQYIITAPRQPLDPAFSQLFPVTLIFRGPSTANTNRDRQCSATRYSAVPGLVIGAATLLGDGEELAVAPVDPPADAVAPVEAVADGCASLPLLLPLPLAPLAAGT